MNDLVPAPVRAIPSALNLRVHFDERLRPFREMDICVFCKKERWERDIILEETVQGLMGGLKTAYAVAVYQMWNNMVKEAVDTAVQRFDARLPQEKVREFWNDDLNAVLAFMINHGKVEPKPAWRPTWRRPL